MNEIYYIKKHNVWGSPTLNWECHGMFCTSSTDGLQNCDEPILKDIKSISIANKEG